jgi:hypothetical protein
MRLSGPSSPRKGEVSAEPMSMEAPEQRQWDPSCPQCQEELRRLLELSQGVYDDVDHGAALYRLPLPDCSHQEREHMS